MSKTLRYQFIFAWLLSIGILVFSVFYFSSGLKSGFYLHSDEYLTLERSHNFLKFEDWFSIYSNNKINFKKPPLQYWMTGVLLDYGVDDFFSIRIVSFIFFIGVCIGSIFLTQHIFPENPWAPPSCLFLLISSPEMVENARSGLLDTGMALFLLLSILAFFKARKDDRWWLACGLAVGLGSLQKAPLALLTVVMFFVVCEIRGWQGCSLRRLAGNRNFRFACAVAVILTLSWPVLQVLRHGGGYLETAYGSEMLERFAPGISSRQEFWRWIVWFWQDWGVAWPFAFGCAVWAVWSRKDRADGPIFLMGVFVLVASLCLTLASGRLFQRYLTALVPVLSCLAAGVGGALFPRKFLVLPVAVLFFWFSHGAVGNAMNRIHHDNTTYVRKVCRFFQENMDGAKFLVVDRQTIPPGAFGRYVGTKIPVQVINHDKIGDPGKFRSRVTCPAMGVESVGLEGELREIVGEFTVIWSDGRTFIWRSAPCASRDQNPLAEDGE